MLQKIRFDIKLTPTPLSFPVVNPVQHFMEETNLKSVTLEWYHVFFPGLSCLVPS